MRKIMIVICCLLVFGSVVYAEESIVVATGANLRNLDPQNGTDNNSISVQRLMVEGLVQFDKDFKTVIPLLATSWEISQGGTLYTFKLRQGVYFHDGTPFNASAVKVNIDRVRIKKNKNRRYGFFKMITQVDVIDEFTVAVMLDQPFGAMLNNFAGPGGGLQSPTALAKHGKKVSRNPVGTGPFKFAEWVTGDHLTVTKNTNYWRKGFPKVDKITVRPVPENGARVAMLKTGEADFIYPFPVEQLDVVKANKDIKVNFMEGITTDYITLNMMHKPFNDLRVRQAVNLAVDKQTYLDISVGGHGTIPDSIIAPGVPFYVKQTPFEYNPEKAKQLLKEAGYPNGFNVELWSNPRADRIEMMEFVQQQLAQVGIQVKLVPMEGGIIRQRTNQWKDPKTAQVRMQIRGWSPSNYDADWGLRPLLSKDFQPPNGGNSAYYTNPEFEKLLVAGLTTADREERKKIYAEIQPIIWKDVPWLIMSVKNKISANRADVRNTFNHPDGTWNVLESYRVR